MTDFGIFHAGGDERAKAHAGWNLRGLRQIGNFGTR